MGDEGEVRDKTVSRRRQPTERSMSNLYIKIAGRAGADMMARKRRRYGEARVMDQVYGYALIFIFYSLALFWLLCPYYCYFAVLEELIFTQQWLPIIYIFFFYGKIT